ncbi:NlpC/P60 family protein [Oceaniovalibus guishaninsula JLT2003]|uniref:NlpC/P60 family protein n=1 Tax=Oceaniovalibus guishaninsula JLT2003 TaxID=1231392 RepID=K2I5D2_9RHOB|nr:NlpC/P60 family protein [Oceaniovalibus guishaninsula]EKE44110.1 NlpC/P60 family protein [Oceaniovalibus guishaninsula JLT2003]
MTDRRLLPANGRVAADHLRGRVEAERFVRGEAAAVRVPLTDLWADREGTRRDRQLLMGAGVTVYDRDGGMAFVAAARDGYVGYVALAALGPPSQVSHVVGVPASHLYPAPDMKRIEVARLSFGAGLSIVAASGTFFETAEGLFVPRAHLRPANRPMTDPAGAAQLFFGVPYLWGGNSSDGIDCSGLVQAALLACGLPCPGDADLQERAAGIPLDDAEPLRRGDLLFWPGHVAMAVDGDVLIHANAHTMAVSYEPVAQAVQRIAGAGDGDVTSRRRPALTPPRG